jgi:tetratricopeptide (TPR) repeat protein
VYSRFVVPPPAIRAFALAFLVCLISPSIGRAQSAPPDSEARRHALELFHQSAEHYRAGRFVEAADLLTEAYALFPEPLLLLNLARALEGLEDLEGALDAYERYLDASPNAQDRVVVERRMSLLRNALEERRAREALEARLREQREEQADTPAAAAAAEEAPSEHARGPGPWILTGTGTALLVTGIVTGVFARDRHADAAAEPVHSVASDLAVQSDRLAASTNALLVIGGVAAAAGVTWGVVRAVRGRDESSPSLEVSVGLGTVALQGTFGRH